jgi:hypothetical protein
MKGDGSGWAMDGRTKTIPRKDIVCILYPDVQGAILVVGL